METYKTELYHTKIKTYDPDFSKVFTLDREHGAPYLLEDASEMDAVPSLVQILHEKEFVPTKKQFIALTQNRYAKKIIDSHYKKPDYTEGSYVRLRKTTDSELLREVGAGACIVIKANAAPIIHARKGAKKYKILPFDSFRMYTVEERDLKKVNIK